MEKQNRSKNCKITVEEKQRTKRPVPGRGRNKIGRREKWPKQSWEEGEIGGKRREEGEKET